MTNKKINSIYEAERWRMFYECNWSTYNFIYNTKTGKLSTKDGSKNEFVDFCNGDVKGEDTETLNHFDEHTRYQFTRMLYAYGTGMTGQNPFADDEEVEITADIDSATER